MKLLTIRSFSAAASLLLMASAATTQAQAAPVHNIVLVHGAFVTGAGWEPVYNILVKDGYHVSVAQHPLTSVSEDVSAVNRVLAMPSLARSTRHVSTECTRRSVGSREWREVLPA